MKKHLSLLTAALLLTGASSAFAASSTDLTVKGIITPVACTPSLSGGGIVDFGKISAKDLNPTNETKLVDHMVQLTVKCDASTVFAIQPVDNRAGSSSHGNTAYGLGLINGTQKLGRYYLSFLNPVSAIASSVLTTDDDGTTWFDLDDSAAVPEKMVAFGNRTGGVWAPHPLTDVVVDIALNTAIARTDSLTLTDEVQIDGSATLEVVYL
ncbi:DUF1120 domain-containing protein [Pseudomonas sp. XS1P51]